MPTSNRLSLVALEDRSTPATFSVTTTTDNGDNAAPTPGSLRAAILSANSAAGVDDITFAIAGGGVQTITPPTPLPTITGTTNLDASTQTGFASTPLIRLSGSKAGTGANGLFALNHSGTTIRGFAIGGFDGAGVRFDAVANGRIVGSFIGTDALGTTADANGVGILLINNASANGVGGADRDRMVVSGNRDDGIRIAGGANQNTITVSNIGTDVGGAAKLANGGDGIELSGGASKNLIGGTDAGAGNLISGNVGNGVRVADPTTGGNTIAGNRIGLSFNGTALGNGVDGVRAEAAAGVTATNPNQTFVTTNTISQNTGNGITVRDGSRFVRIAANSIFDNTGLGIFVSPTSNDGLGAPTITAADPTDTGVQVTGTFTGRPSTEYILTLFTNTIADPSGAGEGRTPVGTATVTTAADGSGKFVLSAGASPGRFLTATATNSALGDTSAFSNALAVTGTSIVTRLFAVGAGAGRPGEVNVYRPDGTLMYTLTPFGADFTGGVRVATADFNRDGTADIVAGTGPGRATQVVVFNGVTKAELGRLDPFEAAFTGGVYVSAGDLSGDGTAELAISPDEGGGPRVDVYAASTATGVLAKAASFFGIDDVNFRGGARTAIGNLNADRNGDLIVAAGFGGGPRVAAFTGQSVVAGTPAHVFGDFFAFEQTLRNGVFITAGDINTDGFDDLMAGGGPGGGPRVTVFSGKSLVSNTQTPLANFFAGDTANRGGIRVAAKDLDADGKADLVTGAGTEAGSKVNVYLGSTLTGTPTASVSFDAFAGFTGGVFVG